MSFFRSVLTTFALAVALSSSAIGQTTPMETNKASGDPTYQQIRLASSSNVAFGGDFATVNNLVLKRDAGTFTLQSGEIYFLKPVEGRYFGAVFIGNGDFFLAPPTEIERKGLNVFTKSAEVRESFNQLVIRFTDDTFTEIKASSSATMGQNGPQAAKALSIYRDKETVWRKTLNENLDLRTLMDIYSAPRPGCFTAFINGARYNKLVFRLDPLGLEDLYPEQVAVDSYGDTDGGTWTAFHLAAEYRLEGSVNGRQRGTYDISSHVMDVTIKGVRLSATDQITFSPRLAGERVLPFDLYGTLRVSGVKDESGKSLAFVQEGKDDDPKLGIILPSPGDVGKSYKFTVEYSGEGALKDSGAGNYYLLPRATWYPNNGYSAFGDRATFDLTFHFPKGNLLVGVGALSEPEKVEGDLKTARWTSGTVELQVGGFNYGKFKKKDLVDKDTGYGVEFYANEEPPDEFKDLQLYIDDLKRKGYMVEANLDVISPISMANSALTDTQNSTRLYTLYFGKLPYSRVAMTQQPQGFFGQAWPTLVFMPYLAFIDSNQRFQLFGAKGATDLFWAYVGPHEVSHQWWGHMVGWKSYHDQWMSEGFAEFSTSLYAQYIRKDIAKFTALWDDFRKRITQASEATENKKPYLVGPISQGYRLNSGKTGAVAQNLIYPKGAYVLHMIRMMMFDPRNGGDKRFIEMMHDFTGTYANKDVTTDDFKHVVEKYMTPGMDVSKNKTMDWFFSEWVDGTDIPEYKFDYQIGTGADGKPTISGRITQSGVSKNFAMSVPIYLDFGSGYVRLGSITLVGNSSFDLPPVPLAQAPKRVTLCAMSDVLYTNLEVNKR